MLEDIKCRINRNFKLNYHYQHNRVSKKIEKCKTCCNSFEYLRSMDFIDEVRKCLIVETVKISPKVKLNTPMTSKRSVFTKMDDSDLTTCPSTAKKNDFEITPMKPIKQSHSPKFLSPL